MAKPIKPVIIRGTGKDDMLLGTTDDDLIIGLKGNDTLSGLEGNDILIGGAGADVLMGGDGLDFASYSTSAGPITVSLLDPSTNTGDAVGDTYVGIEGLVGTSAADTLTGRGNISSFLDGGGGGDLLVGGAGIDRAWYNSSTIGLTANLDDPTQNTGDAAGDTYNSIEALVGSNFADVLIGDGNPNLLNGRAGDDSLTGGAGPDEFVFTEATDGVDTITDFNIGDGDKFLLNRNTFAGLGAANGPLPATAFVLGAQADNPDQRIIYDAATGALYFDSDGNGVTEAVQIASIAGSVELSNTDFLLFFSNIT